MDIAYELLRDFVKSTFSGFELNGAGKNQKFLQTQKVPIASLTNSAKAGDGGEFSSSALHFHGEGGGDSDD